MARGAQSAPRSCPSTSLLCALAHLEGCNAGTHQRPHSGSHRRRRHVVVLQTWWRWAGAAHVCGTGTALEQAVGRCQACALCCVARGCAAALERAHRCERQAGRQATVGQHILEVATGSWALPEGNVKRAIKMQRAAMRRVLAAAPVPLMGAYEPPHQPSKQPNQPAHAHPPHPARVHPPGPWWSAAFRRGGRTAHPARRPRQRTTWTPGGGASTAWARFAEVAAALLGPSHGTHPSLFAPGQLTRRSGAARPQRAGRAGAPACAAAAQRRGAGGL